MARPKGAPSKYKKEFCEQLVEHMSQGLSFESFAAVIDVNQDTLYEWAKVHEDFSESKKAARNKCMLFWERAGIQGMNSDSFKSPVWIYNMKCRFPDQWADKKETEITGTPIQINIDSSDEKL